MEWWQALVLGLVEGITEYLPVSSTGHLVITNSLTGLSDPAKPEVAESARSFAIVIQGGAILAVLGLYFPRVIQMVRGVLGRDPQGLRLLVNLAVAFAPAAVLGKLAGEWVRSTLFHAGPVVAALMLGGVYMLVVDRWRRRGAAAGAEPMATEPEDGGPGLAPGSIESLTPIQALTIGLLQCVAMWPGISRSMMTITGGYMMRLRPRAAAEFSFLLGLPTLGAATLYSLYKDVAAGDGHDLFTRLGLWPSVIGLVVAAVSAAAAVRWLVAFLNHHGLALFGWYRLALGAVLLVLAQAGMVNFAR